MINITAQQLFAYATNNGWVQVPEAEKDGLYVFTKLKRSYTKLIFPMDTDHPFFQKMVANAIDEIYDGTCLHKSQIIEAIQRYKPKYAEEREWIASLVINEITEKTVECSMVTAPHESSRNYTFANTKLFEGFEVGDSVDMYQLITKNKVETFYVKKTE